MASTNVEDQKNAIRGHIWDLLEQHNAALDADVHGRIPNFVGSEAAADRLAGLPVWRTSHVVKAVPDKAQLPARVRGTAREQARLHGSAEAGQTASLLPARPRDPDRFPGSRRDRRWCRPGRAQRRSRRTPSDRPRVCGSVAVNRDGVRLGKGAGYSDLEVALLQEAGLIGPETTIVTTVHPLQVVDGDLPETEHDFSVDLIITPGETIKCGPSRRPTGLIWEHLTPEKIAAIPTLAARAPGKPGP